MVGYGCPIDKITNVDYSVTFPCFLDVEKEVYKIWQHRRAMGVRQNEYVVCHNVSLFFGENYTLGYSERVSPGSGVTSILRRLISSDLGFECVVGDGVSW